MDKLKSSSAEAIYKVLPEQTIIDLIQSFSSKKRLFPAVINFSPRKGYKRSKNKVKYTRDLFKFMKYTHKLYENGKDDMLRDIMYEDYVGQIFYDSLDEIFVEEISEFYGKLKKGVIEETDSDKLSESIGSSEDVMDDNFEGSIQSDSESSSEDFIDELEVLNIFDLIITHTKDAIKYGDISYRYDFMFKVGMNYKDSIRFLKFLDEHNARAFFNIKQIPLFSLNKVYLGDNEYVHQHELIKESRDETSYISDKETTITYVFK